MDECKPLAPGPGRSSSAHASTSRRAAAAAAAPDISTVPPADLRVCVPW